MEKRINLKIKDYRDSFDEPHIKKPYYLYIEYGSERFYFSNKNKADRFLSKFNYESTNLFKELSIYIEKSFYYNLQLCPILDKPKFTDLKNQIDHIIVRYHFVLTNSTQSIQIGREINNIYFQLENLFQFFKQFLQKHNRYNNLLQNLLYYFKSLIRLKTDFDSLLKNVDGIHEVTKIPTSKNYIHFLKIA